MCQSGRPSYARHLTEIEYNSLHRNLITNEHNPFHTKIFKERDKEIAGAIKRDRAVTGETMTGAAGKPQGLYHAQLLCLPSCVGLGFRRFWWAEKRICPHEWDYSS